MLLNKTIEAELEYAHSEVKEELELEEETYYMKKLNKEYSGDLLAYLKEKGDINEEGKVNISILLKGNEIATGKEKVPGKDFYKIVEQTAETGSVTQVASTEVVKIAYNTEKESKKYDIIYIK